MASRSQSSACLCLLSTGFKDVCHHSWPVFNHFYFSLFFFSCSSIIHTTIWKMTHNSVYSLRYCCTLCTLMALFKTFNVRSSHLFWYRLISVCFFVLFFLRDGVCAQPLNCPHFPDLVTFFRDPYFTVNLVPFYVSLNFVLEKTSYLQKSLFACVHTCVRAHTHTDSCTDAQTYA